MVEATFAAAPTIRASHMSNFRPSIIKECPPIIGAPILESAPSPSFPLACALANNRSTSLDIYRLGKLPGEVIIDSSQNPGILMARGGALLCHASYPSIKTASFYR
jgi:hypothetical protein